MRVLSEGWNLLQIFRPEKNPLSLQKGEKEEEEEAGEMLSGTWEIGGNSSLYRIFRMGKQAKKKRSSCQILSEFTKVHASYKNLTL